MKYFYPTFYCTFTLTNLLTKNQNQRNRGCISYDRFYFSFVFFPFCTFVGISNDSFMPFCVCLYTWISLNDLIAQIDFEFFYFFILFYFIISKEKKLHCYQYLRWLQEENKTELNGNFKNKTHLPLNKSLTSVQIRH